MPESKRSKAISLTKVKPKTHDHKETIVKRVQLYVKKFKYTYVLSFRNMSNGSFQQFRESMTDSKFLMGKNRVIGIAFGKSEEDSHKPNLYKLTSVQFVIIFS